MNIYLFVFQSILMLSISELKHHKKVNKEKTFRNISESIAELKYLTVNQKLKGQKIYTKKQSELTEILIKYEDKELNEETKLEVSKECVALIANKYDLFLACVYFVVFVSAFFFPFWDYYFALLFPFLIINLILIGIFVLGLGMLVRFSLRQKLFGKIFVFTIFAFFLIMAIVPSH